MRVLGRDRPPDEPEPTGDTPPASGAGSAAPERVAPFGPSEFDRPWYGTPASAPVSHVTAVPDDDASPGPSGPDSGGADAAEATPPESRRLAAGRRRPEPAPMPEPIPAAKVISRRPDTLSAAEGVGDGSEVGKVVRRPRKGPDGEVLRAEARRLTLFQTVFTVAALGALIGLVFVGRNVVLGLTGSATLDVVTDPNAAGYRAEAEPTPVTLAIILDPAGAPATAALMMRYPSGGMVVPVPTDLLLPTGEPETDVARGALPGPTEGDRTISLTDLYTQQGAEAVGRQFGLSLAAQVGSTIVVPSTEAAAVMGRRGAITVDNPGDLIRADRTVAYRGGPVRLEPMAIVDFLSRVDPREIAPNRMLRSQLVWNAVLGGAEGASGASGAVAATGDNAPVEGFAALVEAIASGPHTTGVLPIDELRPATATAAGQYWTSRFRAPEFVANTIPFPRGAVPGQRQRVAVLAGRVGLDTSKAMRELVQYGAEIVQVGNAPDLNATGSAYRFERGNQRAEAVATFLGTAHQATIEPLPGTPNIELEVVIGEEWK